MKAFSHAVLGVALSLCLATGGGCAHYSDGPEFADAIPDVPRERCMTILKDYVIESPDLLQIDLIDAVPIPPYRIQPLDVLALDVVGTIAAEPLTGQYGVDPDGSITLGGRFGKIKVAGFSPEEAQAAVQKHLETVLTQPKVRLVVIEGRGVQLVRGQHLVRPDGTVTLGTYGAVTVAGRTLPEAKQLIQAQLASFLQNPNVVVTVAGYNSKVYYVIFDFGGAGQQLIRLPVTGNDTVLDAMSQVNGLTSVSDPRRVWVARSAGPGEPDQLLPVDWHAMTSRGRTESNYQLMPGDRIFVKAYPLVTADTTLARILAPLERTLGFTLLGAGTYQQVNAAARGITTGITTSVR